MADTEITYDVANAPEALAIDPEDPRHLNAAQLRVAAADANLKRLLKLIHERPAAPATATPTKPEPSR